MKEHAINDKNVILIAEDDEFNLLYLNTILCEKNYKIISAVNGKEAVELCRAHSEISLVLMDIKMPVMDGIEATRKIKSFRQSLPIIAVSAYCLDDDQKGLKEVGFDDFVFKPVNKNILLEKVSEYQK